MTGILKTKKEAKQATETFKVREFVITDPATQYPQHIAFQVTQDRCSLLDNFQEGDLVKIGFYIKGREWQSREGELKYFNSLEVWKIDGAKVENPAKSNTATFLEKDTLSFEYVPKKNYDYVTAQEDDDLPF